MRSGQTRAEARLWSRLRAARLNGHKFVRQHPVGSYVADFACRSAFLIVELDGATHGEDVEMDRDERRTRALALAGYRVIRVQNHEVADNIDGVCETILAELERRTSL